MRFVGESFNGVQFFILRWSKFEVRSFLTYILHSLWKFTGIRQLGGTFETNSNRILMVHQVWAISYGLWNFKSHTTEKCFWIKWLNNCSFCLIFRMLRIAQRLSLRISRLFSHDYNKIVNNNKCVVFMKGTPDAPQVPQIIDFNNWPLLTDTGEDSKLVHRRIWAKVCTAPPRYSWVGLEGRRSKRTNRPKVGL